MFAYAELKNSATARLLAGTMLPHDWVLAVSPREPASASEPIDDERARELDDDESRLCDDCGDGLSDDDEGDVCDSCADARGYRDCGSCEVRAHVGCMTTCTQCDEDICEDCARPGTDGLVCVDCAGEDAE